MSWRRPVLAAAACWLQVTIGLSVVLNALYVLATAALLGWELTVVTVAVSLLLVVYTVIVLLRVGAHALPPPLPLAPREPRRPALHHTVPCQRPARAYTPCWRAAPPSCPVAPQADGDGAWVLLGSQRPACPAVGDHPAVVHGAVRSPHPPLAPPRSWSSRRRGAPGPRRASASRSSLRAPPSPSRCCTRCPPSPGSTCASRRRRPAGARSGCPCTPLTWALRRAALTR